MAEKSLLQKLYDGFRDLGQLIFPELQKERDLSITQIGSQVFKAAMEGDSWFWLIDLYVDDVTRDIYGIFSKEGLLYRSPITILNGKASIGDMTEVQQYFQPVSQNRMIMRKQADNSVRWFLQASSAVLNRGGEIDSTELFDNMNRRAQESGKYPFLTFYHLDELMRMGVADWVGRSDNILLASGLFDKDNPVADAMIRAYEKDPDFWGASINYFPLDGHMETIAENVRVPMYTDGEYYEISVLPETQACCLFTALHSERKVTDMKKELRDALEKLFEGDAATLDVIVKAVDGDNEEIAKKRLISREAETSTPVPAETPSKTPAPAEEEEEVQVELDDSAMTLIVSRTVEAFKKEVLPGLNETISEIRAQAETATRELQELRASNQASSDKLSRSLQGLEKKYEAREQELQSDLPRSASVRITHRAKEQPDKNENPTSTQIAEETLSKLK